MSITPLSVPSSAAESPRHEEAIMAIRMRTAGQPPLAPLLSADQVLVFGKDGWGDRLGMSLLFSFMSGLPLVFLMFWTNPLDVVTSLSKEEPVLVFFGGLWFLSMFLVAINIAISVNELTLDFARLVYQVRQGLWPFLRIETGSFSAISHLCLETSTWIHGNTKTAGRPRYRVQLNLVWKHDHQKSFALLSEDSEYDKKSLAEARVKLQPYATWLAAELRVSLRSATTNTLAWGTFGPYTRNLN